MNRLLLITRPDHDEVTRYLSRWSEKIIDFAKTKGAAVVDLPHRRANRKEFASVIEKKKPDLVILNGHGNDSQVAGYDDEVILDLKNLDLLNLKIVYARSCQSAKILGGVSVSRGAKAYLGYKEDFALVYNSDNVSRPIEDKTAELFLEPSNYIAISLLKGHSAGEADDKSKTLFRKTIEKLLIEGPLSEDYRAIRFLFWDMINQVCLGSREATL